MRKDIEDAAKAPITFDASERASAVLLRRIADAFVTLLEADDADVTVEPCVGTIAGNIVPDLGVWVGVGGRQSGVVITTIVLGERIQTWLSLRPHAPYDQIQQRSWTLIQTKGPDLYLMQNPTDDEVIATARSIVDVLRKRVSRKSF